MVSGGAMPVGSSRMMRLDPHTLPIRFTAADAAADGRKRQIEIACNRVVIRRAVRGIPMAVRVPMTAFLGVALTLVPSDGRAPDLLEVTLAHRDGALSIPLFVAADSDDIIAEWQLWARVLARPLLIANLDGSFRAPFPCLGRVRVGEPALRRRRRSALRARRPRFLMRRRRGCVAPERIVHRGEREIVARN